jgi:hypothetical protein
MKLRRLFAIAALLAVCALPHDLSYGGVASGNLSIDVVPSGAPAAPPQAVAAGYTTLALNQDWTTGPFSLDCSGQDGAGTWHRYLNGLIYTPDCSYLTWPYNDNGAQVLRMQNNPTVPAGGNVGIVTSSNNQTVHVDFPVNMYVECTKRESINITPTQEIDLGSGTFAPSGMWACWTWGLSSNSYPPGITPAGCNVNPSICIEFDLEEEHHPIKHGGWPIGGQYDGGGVNWGGGGVITSFNWYLNKMTGFQPTWCSVGPCVFSDGSTAGPVLDPSNGYHTYGLLIQSDKTGADPHCGGIPCIKTSSYRDNQGPYWSYWFNAASGNEFLQRNFLMSYVPAACYETNQGYWGCSNLGVVATNNVGGTLQITLNRNDGDGILYFSQFNDSVVYMKGLGGNVPDGNYYFHALNPQDQNPLVVTLALTSGGTPLGYSGGYSSGAAMNPVSSVNLFMKSYRVWVGCSNWQTTQC